MTDSSMTPRGPAAGSASPRRSGDDRSAQLRALAAQAYQARASARGAEHFLMQPGTADRDTGSWLISCTVTQAEDLAADLDALAHSLKEGPPEPALNLPVQKLRIRVHQLHAAARAADHFLEQDSRDDHETGSWLITTALGLADKLAAELDDLASSLKRSANDGAMDADHAAIARRAASATAV
jgi:hypothetical protein